MAGVRWLSTAVIFAGAALPLLPETAHAQSQDELERARQQFRQGLSLEAAGDWAAALAKFQEVGKVKLTPQVRFHSARCSEQLGRLNEALGEYRLAEYEAGQQGLRETAEITQARQALESRVPKLVIRRGEGAAAARIELDGVELGESQIGQPVNVDPGPHTVVAKLGADRQIEQSPTVKEGETAEVVLNAPAVLTQEVTNTTADTGPVAPDSRGKPHPSVLPWVVGGVGVASLAASGVFFGLRQVAKSDLDKGCDGNVCPKSLQGKEDDGKLFTTLSFVTLGVGVAGVGVATYLFIAGSGKAKEQASSLPVDVAITPAGGFVTVRGQL
ncbi:MAG TPA: hypothetical protein VHC69_11860 [Polyangiaceae bacterium]|nr:hypothetical protein [Polyangiaceae bacterium]